MFKADKLACNKWVEVPLHNNRKEVINPHLTGVAEEATLRVNLDSLKEAKAKVHREVVNKDKGHKEVAKDKDHKEEVVICQQLLDLLDNFNLIFKESYTLM